LAGSMTDPPYKSIALTVVSGPNSDAREWSPSCVRSCPARGGM